MSTPEGTVRPARWADASQGFGEAVARYYEARGVAADAPNVQSTIRTNTEVVPQRADHLVELFGALTDGQSLAGRRVLEVGSGFGALTGYLAWRYEPSALSTIDYRPDFVEAAQASVPALGLGGRLRFAVGDMRELGQLDEQGFDVVIVNNAFIYLAARGEMSDALRGMYEILAPGGFVLMFHANRWSWREPFTRAPIVHLLPGPIARPLSRITGWKHNHGRVRLVGPGQSTADDAPCRLPRRHGRCDRARHHRARTSRSVLRDRGPKARGASFVGLGELPADD